MEMTFIEEVLAILGIMWGVQLTFVFLMFSFDEFKTKKEFWLALLPIWIWVFIIVGIIVGTGKFLKTYKKMK